MILDLIVNIKITKTNLIIREKVQITLLNQILLQLYLNKNIVNQNHISVSTIKVVSFFAVSGM